MIPELLYPHKTNPSCPPQLAVAREVRRCPRCGEMTAVWWDGQPGHMPGSCAATAADDGRPVEDPLRLLRMLESSLSPTVRHHLPFWRAPMPGIVWGAHVVSGYAWSRPWSGDVVSIDRNGAFLAAVCSVDVVHGDYARTGACEYAKRPGYYQVRVYPWYESTMPPPLRSVNTDTVWVPEPTYRLLSDLTAQDRWPDDTILDSYTGIPVRLKKWGNFIRDKRADILSNHGPTSSQYLDLKQTFGQSLSLMLGEDNPGHGRKWRCKAARPDWTHHIQAQASAMLWRHADRIRLMCRDYLRGPRPGPVAMRNIDEIVLPAESLAVLPLPGDHSDMLGPKLDNSGLRIGTYKIKSHEQA